jgi:hypothetical protein
MNPKAHKIVESLGQMVGSDVYSATIAPSRQMPLMAELLVIVAEEQEKSALKVERQTDKLICLTWALVGLTFILLLFTVYLSYDVYQHREHQTLTDEHSTQQR